MGISKMFQRVQFLQTTWKRLKKPLAAIGRIPPVFRVAAFVLFVLVVAAYIKFQSAGWGNVLLFLAVVAVVAVGFWFVDRAIRRRQRRMDDSFVGDLAGTEMVEELRGQWLRAVKELDAAGVNRYNMAFYMLIGEPQSGKTTTLTKSGLQFPIGMESIQGIGGTKNLDWWFTDEAVILDTAGRLTFQDAEMTDEEEWKEFLGLLRQYRPRGPVNGVIITIPCTSLLEDDAETRARKAQVLRSALVEVERSLEVQFPVYVLVTKADRVGGFADFFGRMRAMDQTQLLGWSRSRENFNRPFSVDEVRSGFRDLVHRMRRWRILLLDQLGDEIEEAERDRMYPFPDELAELEQPLLAYLETVFPDSRLLDPLFFRGFYITSGVQKGVPVLEACARALGGGAIGRRVLEQSALNSERAYFIRDFYRKKVFQERGLIVPTRARVRRVMLVKRVGYTAAALLALVGTLGIGLKLRTITREVSGPAKQMQSLNLAMRGTGKAPNEAVPDVLEALDQIARGGSAGAAMRTGLEPDDPIAESRILDIFEGELLRAGGLFSAAGVSVEEVQDQLARAIRFSFTDGVLEPTLRTALDSLLPADELVKVGAATLTPAQRFELQKGAITDAFAMIADAARATRASMSDRGDSKYVPPAEIDDWLALALAGQDGSGVRSPIEKGRAVYEMMHRLYGSSGGWVFRRPEGMEMQFGFGLAWPWKEQADTKELQQLNDAVAAVRDAVKRELSLGSTPNPASSIFGELAGKGQRDVSDGLRPFAQALLRSATLEYKLIESVQRLESWRDPRSGSGLGSKDDRDLWLAEYERFCGVDRELTELLQSTSKVKPTSVHDSLIELIEPVNQWYQGLVDVKVEVGGDAAANSFGLGSVWEQLEEPAADGEAPLRWVDVSMDSGAEFEWVQGVLSQLEAKSEEAGGGPPDLVHLAIDKASGRTGIAATRRLQFIRDELNRTRVAIDALNDLEADPLRSWMESTSGILPDVAIDTLTEPASDGRLRGLFGIVVTTEMDGFRHWIRRLNDHYESEWRLIETDGGGSEADAFLTSQQLLRRNILVLALEREAKLLAGAFSESAVTEFPWHPLTADEGKGLGEFVVESRFAFDALRTTAVMAASLVEDAQKVPGLKESTKSALVKAAEIQLLNYEADWQEHWARARTDAVQLAARQADEFSKPGRPNEVFPNDRTDNWVDRVIGIRRKLAVLALGADQNVVFPELPAALERSDAGQRLQGIRKVVLDSRARFVAADYSNNTLETLRGYLADRELFDPSSRADIGHWTSRFGQETVRDQITSLRRTYTVADPDAVFLLPIDLGVSDLVSDFQIRAEKAVSDYRAERYKSIVRGLEQGGLARYGAARTAVEGDPDVDGILAKGGAFDRYRSLFGPTGVGTYSYISPMAGEGGDGVLETQPFLSLKPLQPKYGAALSRIDDLARYYQWLRREPDDGRRPELTVQVDEETEGASNALSGLDIATGAERGKSDSSRSASFALRFIPSEVKRLELGNGAIRIAIATATGSSDAGIQLRLPQDLINDSTPGRASKGPEIAYNGWDGVLRLFQTTGASQVGNGVVGFTYGVSPSSQMRRTVVAYPLQLDRTEEDVDQSSGTLTLKFTFEGVWLPRIPITAPRIN
ncbi:MAG: type VI secretion protein IcmF/TssM N-terminal domain-containing protein [Planctomycetota bacterium]